MGEVLNKIVDGFKHAPESVKNHVKKHPVIYGVITALFFATLFLTGVGGSFALIGGHAAWAPHFMSAMNTAISGTWSGLPYAMTAAGGVGGAGLLGTAIASIIIGTRNKDPEKAALYYLRKQDEKNLDPVEKQMKNLWAK